MSASGGLSGDNRLVYLIIPWCLKHLCYPTLRSVAFQASLSRNS